MIDACRILRLIRQRKTYVLYVLPYVDVFRCFPFENEEGGLITSFRVHVVPFYVNRALKTCVIGLFECVER